MPDLNQPKSKRGGYRPGAGRKPGSVTTKTRAIAERVIETGDTPLEALGELRRWAMDKFRVACAEDDFTTAAKAAEVAADWASKEAPYIHPRLSSIEASVSATIQSHEQALAELADERAD